MKWDIELLYIIHNSPIYSAIKYLGLEVDIERLLKKNKKENNHEQHIIAHEELCKSLNIKPYWETDIIKEHIRSHDTFQQDMNKQWERLIVHEEIARKTYD